MMSLVVAEGEEEEEAVEEEEGAECNGEADEMREVQRDWGRAGGSEASLKLGCDSLVVQSSAKSMHFSKRTSGRTSNL